MIADRLRVDPDSDAMLGVGALTVTADNVRDPAERTEHELRVVATLSAVSDLADVLKGTTYLGGFYAFHGLTADCGCLTFEEHQHYIDEVNVGGTDVSGIAVTADGDVGAGDRDVVQFLPQRSRGGSTGFLDVLVQRALDVWPERGPEAQSAAWSNVRPMAVDGRDDLWVGTSQGEARRDHVSGQWTEVELPSNNVRAIRHDPVSSGGKIYVATAAGVGVF
jgi:hypothetical protein